MAQNPNSPTVTNFRPNVPDPLRSRKYWRAEHAALNGIIFFLFLKCYFIFFNFCRLKIVPLALSLVCLFVCLDHMRCIPKPMSTLALANNRF